MYIDCNETENFFRELMRCCKYSRCNECIANEFDISICSQEPFDSKKIKELIERTQSWSDEHPINEYPLTEKE